MASNRVKQIAEEIREHVATLLVTGRLSDPRLKGVTVHDVKVAPDLQLARIYYSALGNEDELRAIDQGFRSASGFVRRSLAEALRLRYTPVVVFTFDETTQRAARIHEVLNAVRLESEENPPQPAEELEGGK